MANVTDQSKEDFSDDMDLDMEPDLGELGEGLLDDMDIVDAPVDFESDAVGETPSKTQPVQKQTNLPAKTDKQELAKPATGFDFNFSDFQSLPGVVVGDIGIEVSRLPVERAKFTKDSRALISILSKQVIAVKTHYNESLGSYLCFGGKCCEVDGLVRVKYIFPCLVYDTDKKGKPISKTATYKALSIGKDQYDDIMVISELQGDDITKVDILVSCSDEQYQKLSFQAAGDCRWQKSAQMVKECKEFWNDNMKHIIKAVARSVKAADLDKVLATGAQDVQASVDFDVAFDD